MRLDPLSLSPSCTRDAKENREKVIVARNLRVSDTRMLQVYLLVRCSGMGNKTEPSAFEIQVLSVT